MATVVRRPTEDAAVRAASRSPRPLPSLDDLRVQFAAALRRRDRAGACLCWHRAVRAAGYETGES